MAGASFLREKFIWDGLKNVPGEMPGGTSYCAQLFQKVNSYHEK
jgi:hypothetical protein